MSIFRIKWEWTIPNLLSILRLLLLPVFVTLYLMSNTRPELLYWALGILVLSGLTDLFDGIIARRFHQISDMGKLLDPLADKLTQIAVVLSLAIRHKEMIPLLVICVLKEAAQAIGGMFLLRRGERIQGAKWYGKVSTFVFYGVMALILFIPMPQWLFIGLITLVAVLMLFAFYNYAKVFFTIRRNLPSPHEEDASPQEKEKP